MFWMMMQMLKSVVPPLMCEESVQLGSSLWRKALLAGELLGLPWTVQLQGLDALWSSLWNEGVFPPLYLLQDRISKMNSRKALCAGCVSTEVSLLWAGGLDEIWQPRLLLHSKLEHKRVKCCPKKLQRYKTDVSGCWFKATELLTAKGWSRREKPHQRNSLCPLLSLAKKARLSVKHYTVHMLILLSVV